MQQSHVFWVRVLWWVRDGGSLVYHLINVLFGQLWFCHSITSRFPKSWKDWGNFKISA